MTICIAATCGQGTSLILAADTMVTNRAIPIEFEHPTKKMTPLAENCIALTAGDALAHSELFAIVRNKVGEFRQPSVEQIVHEIKDCYQTVRRQVVNERVLLPRGIPGFHEFYETQRALMPEIAAGIQSEIDNYDYGLEILVGGTTGSSAHIYGIINPGTSFCFDAICFHAIGSGAPHALNALIARRCSAATPLPEALMMVYEAKTMAENAPGVGATTDISVMIPGTFRTLPRADIARLKHVHDKWVRQEPDWAEELKPILSGGDNEDTHADE